MTELTKNLILKSVQENNWEDEKLIAVSCHLSFYNEDATAYVAVEDMVKENAKYAMIESIGDLHHSLVELLESDAVWLKIFEAINRYQEYWDKNVS